MTDHDGPGDIQPKGEPDRRPDLDIDSAFAAIVADFSSPPPAGASPWPASEDLEDEPAPVATPPIERREGVVRRIVLTGTEPVENQDRVDARARADADAGRDDGQDEEEGYVPPEPPPFPRGDLVSRFAWGAVIGGPVFLLLAALIWRDLPSVLLLVALLSFVA
ncbi:MAG TPA: hypothetical protein VHN80_08570, partial [Kineosporiaceae bacterium]|nr:hypothetical protein [Kineosporiaceae bacterium]